jgi:hypothetical protein
MDLLWYTAIFTVDAVMLSLSFCGIVWIHDVQHLYVLLNDLTVSL